MYRGKPAAYSEPIRSKRSPFVFDGDNIQMTRLDGGYVELCFNAKHDAINKLDTQTVTEFRQVTQILTSVSGIKTTNSSPP